MTATLAPTRRSATKNRPTNRRAVCTNAPAARTRSLHLVDLENLVGDPYADGATAERVLDRYLELARWQPGDLVHVAVNPHLALEIGWGLPEGCTLRTASGTDAVDQRLIDSATPEFVARRAGRLVIGSGDHGFIAHACATRTAGVGVLVVARPGSLSGGWRSHSFPVVLLDLDEAGDTDVNTTAATAVAA